MRHSPTLIILASTIILASCGDAPPPVDPAYAAEVKAQWAEREARLTAEDGWLTLTGLYWLSPGANIVGAAPDAHVRLPDGAPLAGSLHLGPDGAVTLLPAPDSDLRVNGDPQSNRSSPPTPPAPRI